MQYKVPQNVDIEDKVIAGLTLRQFAFLMGGGGFILAVKYALPPSLGFLFMPIAVLIAIFAFALAFYKINDRPFEIFLFAAAKTLLTPSQRIWKKEGEVVHEEKVEVKKEKTYSPKKNLKDIRSNLERLAMMVDSGVPESVDDRATNLTTTSEPDGQEVTDVLEKTEESTEKLDEIISDAKNEVDSKNKEKPVSAMATVAPSDSKFKYETLELNNEKDMEKMLEAANEKQKETEEKLKTAKIEKFDRTK
jgi:hypothetical protein